MFKITLECWDEDFNEGIRTSFSADCSAAWQWEPEASEFLHSPEFRLGIIIAQALKALEIPCELAVLCEAIAFVGEVVDASKLIEDVTKAVAQYSDPTTNPEDAGSRNDHEPKATNSTMLG